jgi:hypothetical protein
MAVTLSPDAKKTLIDGIELWIRVPIPRSENDGKFKLKREWQTLAGRINGRSTCTPGYERS